MFTPRSLTFLRQLKRNNRREWFIERKTEFDDLLWAPMREFVEEMDVRLAAFAPELTGSPKRSIFRIYRDVRFSKDKSPYKTHLGAWFTHINAGHGVGSETHGAGAGFYFHLEPGASFSAAGIWMPPREALHAIRDRIAGDVKGFEKTIGTATFRRRVGSLSEEKVLTRVPKPWNADHPAGKWLRHASFTVSAPLGDDEVLRPDVVRRVEKDYRLMLPFARWLNGALGYDARERR
jgi:uncharacterized protein (TIGR02453 family)